MDRAGLKSNTGSRKFKIVKAIIALVNQTSRPPPRIILSNPEVPRSGSPVTISKLFYTRMSVLLGFVLSLHKSKTRPRLGLQSLFDEARSD